MGPSRGTAERLADLVRTGVEPALAGLGFYRSHTSWCRDGGEVEHLVEVAVAPWSTAERLAFTLAWGVAVPGLAAVLGEEVVARQHPRTADCPLRGRLGERPGVDPTWHVVAGLPRPFDGCRAVVDAVDARIASLLVRALEDDLAPRFARLGSVDAVHAAVAAPLADASRVPSDEELARIRLVAALSLVRGERANAGRWLDHLQDRCSRTMAPDLVAERLARLRARCTG